MTWHLHELTQLPARGAPVTAATLAARCERLAARTLHDTNLAKHEDRDVFDPPIIAVGYLCLTLSPRDLLPESAWIDFEAGRITYSKHTEKRRRSWIIGHETGHALIRLDGWRITRADEERAADRIADALMLPARRFIADAKRLGRDVAALVALWPLATPELVERRLGQLA